MTIHQAIIVRGSAPCNGCSAWMNIGHSFDRKTDAGAPRKVSADSPGHDQPRITYGLYSRGTSLAQKREAIEKLAYPEPTREAE